MIAQGLFRLEILVLPLQAGRTGPGNIPNLASPVLNFPMLRGVGEFDRAGPGDFEPAKIV